MLRDNSETYEQLLVAADGSEHEFAFTGQSVAPFKLLSIGSREMLHRTGCQSVGV